MAESKEFHLPSSEHGSMETGTEVKLLKNHKEFGQELSVGSVLTVDSIIHFPTRYHLKDASGKIWTVPIHAVELVSEAAEPEVSEKEPEEVAEKDGEEDKDAS